MWQKIAERSKDGTYEHRSIFEQFMIMWTKIILVRAAENHKEN